MNMYSDDTQCNAKYIIHFDKHYTVFYKNYHEYDH